MSRFFNAEPTLVKYTTPVLVPMKDVKAKKDEKESDESRDVETLSRDISSDRSVSMQQVLDCILPPRKWEENGQLWKQQVSAEPATRGDVLKLGEQLDFTLQQKGAKETGICAERRKLFDQAFDEIIRQVTINCAERGLLLLRIRDEMRMTTASYQSLYESSIAYGMRKALMAEQSRNSLEEELIKLKEEKNDLRNKLLDLRSRYEMMERRAGELKLAEEKMHKDDLATLKKANAQLKNQLLGIIAPKKQIDINK